MMRSRILVLAAALALLAACKADPAPATLVVEVQSDLQVPDELDRVTVQVEGQRLAGEASADLRQQGLPRTVTLVHESGPLGPVRIVVRGYLGAELVLTHERSASFPARGSARLTVALTRDCLNVVCAPGEVCEAGGCVAEPEPELDAGGLAEAGTAPEAGTPEAGELAPDGGTPELPLDGAVPDAGESTRMDGGRDTPADSALPPPGPGRMPVCTIEEPLPNDVVQVNTEVTFRGSCSDPESGPVATGLTWSSVRDGQLATGAMTSGMFRSAGNQRLSLCAPDPRDAGVVGCAAVELAATLVAQPSARIVSASQGNNNGPIFMAGPPITFTGTGSGASVTLSWRDSVQGALGSGTMVSLSSPMAGSHTVTLTVRDRAGREATQTLMFVVLERVRPNN